MKRSFASTIVRVSVWTIALIMSVLIVATPTRAFASDGFLGGLQDLVGERQVERTTYEDDYQQDYEPVLRSGDDTSEVEEQTTQGAIETVVNQTNTAKLFGTTNRPLVQNIPRLFTLYPSMFLMPAVGMVFMWWGVRKAIQVVMSAFRKGSMNV